MTHKELITEVTRFFDIRELVSKCVYDKYQTGAWRFFDPRILETLLVLRRDILRVPLVCNNWKSGGTMQQRGLRENVCEMVRKKTDFDILYISAHCLGQGLDLSSPSMTADQMRASIKKNEDKLPYKVRIEDGKTAKTWLHIDVSCSPEQKEKILVFKG